MVQDIIWIGLFRPVLILLAGCYGGPCHSGILSRNVVLRFRLLGIRPHHRRMPQRALFRYVEALWRHFSICLCLACMRQGHLLRQVGQPLLLRHDLLLRNCNRCLSHRLSARPIGLHLHHVAMMGRCEVLGGTASAYTPEEATQATQSAQSPASCVLLPQRLELPQTVTFADLNSKLLQLLHKCLIIWVF